MNERKHDAAESTPAATTAGNGVVSRSGGTDEETIHIPEVVDPVGEGGGGGAGQTVGGRGRRFVFRRVGGGGGGCLVARCGCLALLSLPPMLLVFGMARAFAGVALWPPTSVISWLLWADIGVCLVLCVALPFYLRMRNSFHR